MATPRYTLPGSAGRYASTPSVNLLDAATAHLLNPFPGQWAGSGATMTDEGAQADGWGKLKAVWTGVITPRINIINQTSPTVTNIEYTFSFTADNRNGASRDIYIRIYIGGSAQTPKTVSVPAGESRLFQTITLPAGDISHIWVAGYNDMQIGDEWGFSKFCLREGSDASFVPSLRIVGDDETEAVVALDDYTPSAAQVLWDDGATKCTLDTAGDFTFEMWGDATAAMSLLSALTDGDRYTFKIVGVESTGVVTFTIDGVTQDTDTLTPASPTYNDFYVGADTAAANTLAGDAYTVTRRDGIDGPSVARFDAADVLAAVS